MIEYHTVQIDFISDIVLNGLGESDWQLITIYNDVAFFSRKQDAPQAMMILPATKPELATHIVAIGKPHG